MTLARTGWTSVLVALAAFTVFAGALSHPPVWDDIGIVRYVENIYRDRGLAGVVQSEWRIDAAAPETGGFYRPVVLLSLWADNRMALSVPWNHHASNVALHVLNSLALLALLTPLLSPVPALLGALLFAVHPVHVESVALATNRTDLLACFFVLASTLAWRRFRSGCPEGSPAWHWFGLSLAAFLLGGLSKEVALVLPAVLLAWSFLEPREARGPAVRWLRTSLPWLLGWSVVVLAILALRHGLGIGFGPGASPSNRSTADAGLSGYLGLWGTYARLLVFPWPLKSWYGMKAITADWSTFVWLGAIIGLSAVPAAGTRDRKSVVGLLWIAAFLLPVSGIVPLSTATAAERFLYLPSVGYGIIVAAALRFLGDRFPRWRTAGLVTLILVILALGSASMKRMAVWASSRSLAEEMIRLTPDDAIGYTNLGQYELERGNYAASLEFTREAARRAPGTAGLQVNLGMAYEGLARTAEAIESYRNAIKLDPANVRVHLRLAALLDSSGRFDEAVDSYEQAIRLEPSDATIYNNFGVLLSRLRRFDEASRVLATAVTLQPGYAEAHYNLGAAALHQGAFDSAITHLSEALRLKPDYTDALNNLGITYAELGRLEDAERSFSRVLEIDPGNAEARGNIERLWAIFPETAPQNLPRP